MAALPAPARARLRRATADPDLVARIRRGDELAFAVMHARHRAALERYALRLLGSHAAAEDAVQDSFVRAHQALLRDDRDIDLKPWLYRLVRNRCLDELRARRSDHVALHEVQEVAPAPSQLSDPVEATHRRQRLQQVVADIAALPDRQREVLLRRELDGESHEQVAGELGLTVAASKKLVNRARENLMKAAEARDDSCADVRRDLLRAHDGRRRASAQVYRHLAGCADCREYRSALTATRASIRALAPMPLLAAVAAAGKAVVASIPGVGGGTGATKVAAGAAMTAVVAGGAIGAVEVIRPGQPAPLTVRSAVFFGGVLYAGEKLPHGTAIVRRTVQLPTTAAGVPAVAHPPVRLACPAGTRVAGLLPSRGAGVSHGYAASTIVGSSTVARLVFEPTALRAPASMTVGTVCKRPNAIGSILAAPVFFAATAQLNRVCARRAYLYETPSGLVVGTVFRGQPVTRVRRTANRRWWRIRTDAGVRGWVRSTALCR